MRSEAAGMANAAASSALQASTANPTLAASSANSTFRSPDRRPAATTRSAITRLTLSASPTHNRLRGGPESACGRFYTAFGA
jgi:hypothetical protein